MGNVPTINAIPTYYKGTEFRSRTEARWAVFFDSLAIEWEFESEGYQGKDGERYLPDFWLPDMNSWFEVKPSSDDGVTKAEWLIDGMWSETGNYYNLFISDGAPSLHRGELSPGFRGIGLTESPGSWGLYTSAKRDYSFYICPFCKKIDIGEFGLAHNPKSVECKLSHSTDVAHGRLRVTGYTPPDYDDIFVLADASDIAMSHRFWNPGGAV